ncbi:S41 family peptidase [Alteromonas stellipolaris]|jgi:carboxyl-terminal processing protease|uniref:S41 family peptidase n=1 Tax=Alteromonas stellipolaris TaxID=233316 RepID=UPI001DFC1662|nr:S41 family peptidase [Alteromonas stellipolaris]MBZ2163298.1 S41 family peptidase [Alteromonas stellipolaris]
MDYLVKQLLCGLLFLMAAIMSSFHSSATAIWKTEGYGYVFDLTNPVKPLVYDISDNYCLLNHFLTDEADRDGVAIDERTNQLDFDKLFPLSVRKLDVLPKTCTSNESSGFQSDIYAFNSRQVLRVLLDSFSYHYAFTEEKELNWKALKSRWLQRTGNNTTPDELQQIIDEFLEYMKDGHAILIDSSLNRLSHHSPRKSASEKRLKKYLAENSEFSDISQVYRYIYGQWINNVESYFSANKPAQYLANNFLIAKLKGGGSYFRIESFDEHETKEVIQKVTPHFNRSKGVIIDLRDSSGGSDLVALQIMSYLIDKPLRIGTKSFKVRTGMSKKKDILVSPANVKPFVGKIVVITSHLTPSAAELFLIALKARSNVTFIGENSYGAISDALIKALPNGWGITLSNEFYADSEGRSYEFVGVPVEHAFEFPNIRDIEENKDSALEYAIKLLGEQPNKN